MIVILDSNENILEFMDDSDASVEITDTYGGYKSLDFTCELTDVKHDEYLYKQGNKLFVDNVLFVLNTEVEIDFVKNLISLEAEEIVYEMNNCEPFYVVDRQYFRYVSGNTVLISKNFLSLLFDGFYTVEETDLPSLKDSEKIVTVNGTITKYNLLKEIEETTGLMFKYSYSLQDNTILKHVSLLKPENYGVTHSKLLEKVIVGENTNKLEYSTDETKNALGIMPIIKSENNSQVDYTKILKQFNELDINNDKIMPYFENYVFFREDIIAAAKTLYSKIDTFKFIPETVTISHEEIYDMSDYDYTVENYHGTWPDNKIYDVDIGMSQFLDLATQVVLSNSDYYPLQVIGLPDNVPNMSLNCVFETTEIAELAVKIQEYISKSNEVNASISTDKGLVSFPWMVYIFAEYLSTNKKVVCKSEDYPKLSKIVPSTVEENGNYIVDYENYESMPFLYTQNTSESSKIPIETPTNSNLTNVIDVSKYISETYPVLKVKKTANAQQVYVKVYTKGIADSDRNSTIINFKDVDKIQNDSEITINYSNQSIEFMKYVETTVEKEIEETVESENPDTITATGKNTCGCCGYPKMPYKNYTRTYENYCPACGRRGTLVFGPKGVVDGEITCGNTGPACRNKGTVNGKPVTRSIRGCDADYCVQCFAEGNYILIRINGQYYRYVDIKELVEVLFAKYDVIETLSVKPGSDKVEWKLITNVFNNGVSDVYKVSFAHNSELIVTGDHTFYPYSRDTKKFMTKKVKTLELNKSTLLGGIIVDKYSDYDSAYNFQIKGVTIKDVEYMGKGNVYNITVEDNHTLFIGNYCNILASNCGGDKWGGGRCRTRKLTPAEASTTETVKRTVTETVGEYKQVTASNDDASADNKSSLSETITDQSSFGAYYGDVQIELVGCTFVSLNSDSCKLYELSPFPYIKKTGEQFIYAPITKADFNYTHMTNNNPKLEPFETSEQSVEEVLIGCWKKLNGSGDNTHWLEKSEDINVDLTEENLDLNAGDFVYIKLPDTLVFKAQIVEKKYDPKIKSDSSLKIGNVTRESII